MKNFIKWLFGIQDLREIVIEQSVLEDISTMSQSAHPKEMLAFFASPGIRKGVLRINEIQLQAYHASNDSAHVFLGYLPMTTSIIGTVHSHPGGSKRPSAADTHLFSKFGMVHAIIGEPYRTTDIQFYNKNGSPITVRVNTLE